MGRNLLSHDMETLVAVVVVVVVVVVGVVWNGGNVVGWLRCRNAWHHQLKL